MCKLSIAACVIAGVAWTTTARADIIFNDINASFALQGSTQVAEGNLSFSYQSWGAGILNTFTSAYIDGGPYQGSYNYNFNSYYGSYGYETNIVSTNGLSFTSGYLLPFGTTIDSSGNFVNSQPAFKSTNYGQINWQHSVTCLTYTNNNCTVHEYIDTSSVYYTYEGLLDYLSPSSNVTGYLGLQYDDGLGNIYYGWAEFGIDSSGGSDYQLSLIGTAYETNPGQTILAGQTSDGSSVPEPAGLAVLLAASTGLAIIRRRYGVSRRLVYR